METIVFIDYQNTYRTAREAFCWEDDAGQFGDFKPLAMGRILTQGDGIELSQVRVYTGVPAQERDSFGYGIMQRRLQAWRDADPSLVEVLDRTLRYPPKQGREKGVDVQLAIDFVRLAIDGAYERAVLISADSDLVPALEFVADKYPNKVIETIGLEALPEGEAAPPLDIPGGGAIRTILTKQDFERVADRRNYRDARSIGPAPGQSGRRLPRDRR